MTYLLDTHALIWFLDSDPALSATAKSIIEDDGSIVQVSIVSLWEIAIKTSINKLVLTYSLDEILREMTAMNMNVLAVSFEVTGGMIGQCL